MHGSIRFAAAAALLLALVASGRPAAAQTGVDLQLVLAVDASGSVDQIRFELQKRGYVAAFRHARVLQAIRSGPNQAIAVLHSTTPNRSGASSIKTSSSSPLEVRQPSDQNGRCRAVSSHNPRRTSDSMKKDCAQ